MRCEREKSPSGAGFEDPPLNRRMANGGERTRLLLPIGPKDRRSESHSRYTSLGVARQHAAPSVQSEEGRTRWVIIAFLHGRSEYMLCSRVEASVEPAREAPDTDAEPTSDVPRVVWTQLQHFFSA